MNELQKALSDAGVKEAMANYPNLMAKFLWMLAGCNAMGQGTDELWELLHEFAGRKHRLLSVGEE